MGKKKSKKSVGKKGRRKGKASAHTNGESNNNWVDQIEFETIINKDLSSDTEDEEDERQKMDFRIVCWNVLAEAYLSPKSHRNLPASYRNVVFDPKRRMSVLKGILGRFVLNETDIVALQEVDLPLVAKSMKEWGYDGVFTSTSRGGATEKVDACCIFWNNQDWKRVDHEQVRLDDLATSGQANDSDKIEPLYGLKRSLLRRNAAIFVRLEHRRIPHARLVVVNTHLYWNPAYEYVKLCQIHYVMQRASAFAKQEGASPDPIVLCGDLNSRPSSHVHQYLTKGKINAKLVSPWYHFDDDDDDNSSGSFEEDCASSEETQVDQITNRVKSSLRIDQRPKKVRYLLDFTLNRFTRWLRILGIDAALETAQEEVQRTKQGCVSLFWRCKEEKRTLVTTSSKLVLRKGCPPGTYLISPNKSLTDLESCFVHMLLTHGVVLEPRNFLSTCVVCNGDICDVLDVERKRAIFAANQAPDLSADLECYECNGCGQGYWWCDRPTSPASRVKQQATRLFELCLRGGVPFEGPLNMFDFVNVEEQQQQQANKEKTKQDTDVVDWLKDTQLTCPVFPLESSYALRDGERLAFSNVTFDFVGLLDYVMFEPSRFTLRGRLRVPTSLADLNTKPPVRNGHLLPSDVWPSDHLAVGAHLTIHVEPKQNGTQEENNSTTKKTPMTAASPCDHTGSCNHPPVEGHHASEVEKHDHDGPCDDHSSKAVTADSCHDDHQHHPPKKIGCSGCSGVSRPGAPPLCRCGSVPTGLSLHEMAALREEAKKKKKTSSSHCCDDTMV